MGSQDRRDTRHFEIVRLDLTAPPGHLCHLPRVGSLTLDACLGGGLDARSRRPYLTTAISLPEQRAGSRWGLLLVEAYSDKYNNMLAEVGNAIEDNRVRIGSND